MNEYIALTTGRGVTRSLALSARPDAPVVDDAARSWSARRWAAARLRGVAHSTDVLANRVDPVCRPRHVAA